MKFVIKSVVIAAAFCAAGAASAAVTTISTGGSAVNGMLLQGGTGKLSFSADLLAALDVGKVGVSSWGDGIAIGAKDSDGYYTEVSATAKISSMVFDDVSGKIQSIATSGGATQTSPVVPKVSNGGFLTVGDLNVDLANKKVYATVIGGNGVGTLSNFYLWDIVNPVTQDLFQVGANQTLSQVSGLQITTAGFNTFVQSLGLLSNGKGALSVISDFGTITTTVSVAAVPEPSTYALMGLGLVGIGFVARRRRAD